MHPYCINSGKEIASNALSELDSAWDDPDLNRSEEPLRSLQFIYIFIISRFSVPLPLNGWWGWWDGRMKGTLCISSIPNSSSSLSYGEREGGEEGERMERRVRKAQTRGVWGKCCERLRATVHDINHRDDREMLVPCLCSQRQRPEMLNMKIWKETMDR